MNTQIFNLFSLSFSPNASNEEREYVTKMLIELYKNPENIINIIDIILNTADSKIRFAAAIGLKRCLNDCWKDVSETKLSSQVKTLFFELLRNESDLTIAYNIINAFEPVLETEAANWEQLFQFIQILPNMNNKLDSLQLTMYLIGSLPRYIPEQITSELFPLFFEFAKVAFQSQDQKRIGSACEMLGILIGFIPEKDIGITMEPLNIMLNVFKQCLFYDDINIICQIANSLNDAVSGNSLPMQPDELLQIFLDILNLDNLNQNKYVYIFNPIMALIRKFGNYLSNTTECLLQSIINAVASCSNGMFFENNDDASYIAKTADEAAEFLNDFEYYDKLKKCAVIAKDESLIYAYILVFYYSLENIEECIVENLTEVIQLIVQWLQIQVPCIQEVTLLCIKDIGEMLIYGEQMEVSTIIIQNILPFATSEYIELCKSSLFALSSCLYNTGISSNMIDIVIKTLFKILSNSEMTELQSSVLDCLEGVVLGAEEDIDIYAEQIFPILHQAASLPETSNTIIKSNAIEALGMLLRFAPMQLKNVFDSSIQLIISSGCTNDLSLRNSVMIAIGNIIFGRFDILKNYKENIIQLVDSFFEQNLFEENLDEKFDEEEDFISEPISWIGLTNVLRLMKYIFKSYPELAPDDISRWIEEITCLSEVQYSEIQITAISAGLYSVLYTKIPDKYLESLIPLFDEKDPDVVAKCFKCCEYLILKDIELPVKFIKFALRKGIMAIEKKLIFQKRKKNWNQKTSQKLYNFFIAILVKKPQIFPFQKFIEMGKFLIKQSQFFELAQYVEVLQVAYKDMHNKIQSLTKRVFIHIINESVSRLLKIYSCEPEEAKPFYVKASPILAIATIIEYDENSVSETVNHILQFVQNVLTSEYNGETYYYSTISYSITFLCSLIRKHPEQFNEYIPFILSKLPLKGEEKLAEFIYSTIIKFFDFENHVIQQNILEFLRVFAQTLGVKNYSFCLYEFSNETLISIVNLTQKMLNQIPNSNVIIQSYFTNQQSFQRFIEKIN